MKLPKKVIISGREWTIEKDSLLSGGAFDAEKALISIGTYGKGMTLELFLHEVLEAIMQERGHRYHLYCDGENEKRLFSFNHAQFTNLVRDLALAIKPIIK